MYCSSMQCKLEHVDKLMYEYHAIKFYLNFNITSQI